MFLKFDESKIFVIFKNEDIFVCGEVRYIFFSSILCLNCCMLVLRMIFLKSFLMKYILVEKLYLEYLNLDGSLYY